MSERVTTYQPAPEHVVGFTQIGEWLLLDARLAARVNEGTLLFEHCRRIADAGAVFVVESTMVIDLLAADAETRAFILDRTNWRDALCAGPPTRPA